MRGRTAAILVAVLYAVGPAAAQEKGRIGVDAAFNGTGVVGVTWHASDHLALRPSLSYSHTSSSGGSSIGSTDSPEASLTTTDDTRSSLAGGLSLLYYLRSAESLSPYLGVAYERTHGSHASTQTGPPRFILAIATPVMPTETIHADDRSNGNVFRAFVGAQHAMSKLFALFGEVGASYSQTDLRTTTSSTYHSSLPRFPDNTQTATQHTNPKQFATFSAQVGAVFYLK